MLMINQLIGFGAVTGRDESIRGEVLRLDVTNASCYGGSGQTLSNLVASPADGSAQADNDFYRGATSASEASDPTFNGAAGDGLLSTYFECDGGDYFTFKGSPTTFLSQAHYHGVGAAFSVCAMVYYPSSGSSFRVLATSDAGTGGGFDVSLSGGSKQFMRFWDQGVSYQTANAATSANTGAWNFLAYSITEAAATSFFYLNGSYNQVSGSDTFTLTMSGTNRAGTGVNIFSDVGGATAVVSGTRLGRISVSNVALTKAEMDAVFAAWRGRYGI